MSKNTELLGNKTVDELTAIIERLATENERQLRDIQAQANTIDWYAEREHEIERHLGVFHTYRLSTITKEQKPHYDELVNALQAIHAILCNLEDN